MVTKHEQVRAQLDRLRVDLVGRVIGIEARVHGLPSAEDWRSIVEKAEECRDALDAAIENKP